MAQRGDFAEWAVVHGHLYGTSRALLNRHFAAGSDVILDIDTQGASILRHAYPDGVSIFIVPPSWAGLEERLRRRQSDAEGEIQRRLQRAREEVKCYVEYQYVIVSDEFTRGKELRYPGRAPLGAGWISVSASLIPSGAGSGGRSGEDVTGCRLRTFWSTWTANTGWSSWPEQAKQLNRGAG
jgi:hypothetical protein